MSRVLQNHRNDAGLLFKSLMTTFVWVPSYIFISYSFLNNPSSFFSLILIPVSLRLLPWLRLYSYPHYLFSLQNYKQNPNFKLLMSPRIYSKESIPPGCVLCSLAGRNDNYNPTQFLAPMDCLKIPAQIAFRP